MTETSLLANVEFDTVKKGYDPEQVDNYLHLLADKVGQLQTMARSAVEQAELAQARLAEAERARSSAEADADHARRDLARAKSERPAKPTISDDGTEELKKVLMLAQRTADNHVEEAQASAKNIVADARTKSAEIVAGAETRAERLLIEAQKIADELVQERSANISETIAELERRRDDLQVDVEVLSRYLSEHRGRLQAGVDTLKSLLDDPRRFRAEAIPELKAEPGSSTVTPPSTPAPAAPRAAGPSSVPGSAGTAGGPSAREAGRSGRPAAAGPAPASGAGPAPGSPGSPTAVRVGNAPGTATAARREPETDFPAVKIPDLLEAPPELGDRVHADGAPTQQIPAADQQSLLDDDEPDLPPLDPTTDEAVRRFLEDDL
jgi:DivIVA domain-containing protein